MKDFAIKVNGIGKRYRVGKMREKQDTLVGLLFQSIKAPIQNFRNIRRLTSFKQNDQNSVNWALKDLNFEIKKGEVVGIIGHNGAGKSTLLKLLSRITAPTEGKISIRGRISALLEVGTGFHPELTGRENVYLNGTILGMTKKEINTKFDEIVSFSGVEKYIDTPVKFYSSGMRVRLGFAVAAHLEPEILVIDEVLAVGDLEFQKKCIGKMQDVAGQGRTVLFVSHNMNTIRSLCKRGILLEQGKLIEDSTVDAVVQQYIESKLNRSRSLQEKINVTDKSLRRWRGRNLSIETIELINTQDQLTDMLQFREPFKIRIQGQTQEDVSNALIQIRICRSDDTQVLFTSTIDKDLVGVNFHKGYFSIETHLDPQLMPGDYNIIVMISNQAAGIMYDTVHNVFYFEVEHIAYKGQNWPFAGTPCSINPNSNWNFSENLSINHL